MFEQVVGEGYFDNHDGTTLTDVIEELINLATELNNKVDNSRVLTDVPANAKFTDTITTINGKTGGNYERGYSCIRNTCSRY